jgi:hypothetical protein
MKIDFEFETAYGLFRDALHLPDDHGFTEAEIESMKEQRRDNWISVLEAPPVEEVVASDYVEIEGVKYVKVTDNG